MSDDSPVPTDGLKYRRFPQVANDQDLIVRRIDQKRIGKEPGEVWYETNDYTKVNQSLKELEQFGIELPDHSMVSEKINGSYANYILIEWVEGKSLDDSPDLHNLFEDEEFVSKVLNTLFNLSNYLKYKIKNKEGIIWDIFELRQFVYGKGREDSEAKVYLVDIDFHFQEYNEDDAGYHMICLFNLIKSLNIVIDSSPILSEGIKDKSMSIVRNLDEIMSFYPDINTARGITKTKLQMFTNNIKQLSDTLGFEEQLQK